MENGHDEQTLSGKLLSYLRAELNHPVMDYVSPPQRIQGGYETATYRFELDGASQELSRPLVLRLYPSFYGTQNAVWESTVQNALAGEGYPVARSYVVCTDMSVLGGAFFIMDHLPGQPLAVAPQEAMPGLLGKSHAELHNIDPAALVNALDEKGVTADQYTRARESEWLRDAAGKLPWVRHAVAWLMDNRPGEPERPVICHGDFHPFNILYADGKITGVLDWPGFAIADPVFDVANSMMLITIPGKHVTASMGEFQSVDWDLLADRYLAAYRTFRPMDDSNLSFYRVRRCVVALLQGIEGQQIWQHPLIVKDLKAYILEISGIQITIPA